MSPHEPRRGVRAPEPLPVHGHHPDDDWQNAIGCYLSKRLDMQAPEIYTGHVTRDAEVRNTRDGKPWLSFNAAVDATRAADEGPTWVRTALFGDDVEGLAPRLCRGAQVYIEGQLRMNTWTGKDGVERSGLNITASRVEILGEIGRPRQGEA